MPTTMREHTFEPGFAGASGNALRPVLLMVLSAKLLVAGFLLLSVWLSPPVSAESRYLAGAGQFVTAN